MDGNQLLMKILASLGLNSKASSGHYPIQDVSTFGMNIIEQFQAEFHDDVIVIEESSDFRKAMSKIKNILDQKRPAIVCFYPEILRSLSNHSYFPKVCLRSTPKKNP